MTREELEEGRRLLHANREHFSEESEQDLAAWFDSHGDELLSLAEDARWRSVTEEPPPALEQVLIDTHADALPVAYMDPVGLWSDANDEYLSERPTHWRPLPKPPETR